DVCAPAHIVIASAIMNSIIPGRRVIAAAGSLDRGERELAPYAARMGKRAQKREAGAERACTPTPRPKNERVLNGYRFCHDEEVQADLSQDRFRILFSA